MTDFKKERRKQQRLERLGTNTPVCACGETDDRCFENHHIAGQKFDGDVVPICRNCHRKVTDDQRDHPSPSSTTPPLMEIVAHALSGIADILILVAEHCRKFAAEIFAAITNEQSKKEI